MYKYEVTEITDKNIWETYLLSKNPGTFLQSWNWGETNRLAGFKIMRLGIYEKNKLMGIALLIHQPAKRGPHYLIPGGPVTDYTNEKLVKAFVEKIKDQAKKDKVWFVRIRPDIEDNDRFRSLFESLSLKYAPMHVHGEHTLILDISKDENKLLNDMRKTTRYLIKKSMREGYKIRTSKDPGDTDILYSLQKETVQRHKFVGFSKKLFDAQLLTFAKDNQALLFICEKDKTPLVAAIIIFYGKKAFYHHSGSSYLARNTNASYFTQWEIIKQAKQMGLNYYDFWGIAPSDDPKHRFAGVTVFKKGFGGEKLDWMHAHDIIISPLYWLTYIFETERRIFRHL